MCSGVFQHWGCTCLFSVCIEVLSQDKQSSGPFNFSVSSSLMRGCRNLDSLSFECCDWSACVGSESWGELPVPPAEVIARGTKGVFEFVKAMLSGGGFHIRGEVVSMKSEIIDLSRRNLIEGELLPLLESFRDGKFPRMQWLNLVPLDCVQYDENAAGCDSCSAGWKPNQRQRRGDDRRGAEGQQKPADAPSCKACFLVLSFDCRWGVVGEDGEGLSCSVRSCIW